jgi:hypothetical protein
MVRPKQEHIKGMEPVVNKEVEKLADEYVEARDARMAALKVEIEAKAKLVMALKGAKLTAYMRGEYDIKLESLDKVKVKIGGEEEETE